MTKSKRTTDTAPGMIDDDTPIGTRFEIPDAAGRKRVFTFAGRDQARPDDEDPTILITDERGLSVISPGTAKDFTLAEWNTSRAPHVTKRLPLGRNGETEAPADQLAEVDE